MGDFVDSAASILAQAQARLELTAHNVSNSGTHGYKRQVSFSETLRNTTYSNHTQNSLSVASDFRDGKLITSSANTDLALIGEGFFAIQAGDQVLYTRNGQFERDAEGRLVTGEGFALQAAGGGDLVTRSPDFTVTSEGLVLEAGEPVGQIAVVRATSPEKLARAISGLYAAGESEVTPMTTPSVRQGMLESSNVSMGDEMVVMMEAIRRAETAQRLINIYDDLMGRVISSFGQA